MLRSVKPSPGFLRYLKFKFWILLLLIDVGIIGLWVVLLVISPLAGLLTAPLFWGVAIIPDIFAYAALHVRYDTTWYIITERSVRIRRGVWMLRENTITFENVQNVEVRQGPLQRHFGIADVTIQTAGGGGAAGPHGHQSLGGHNGLLEGVEAAAELRDLIMHRAMTSRGAGLGDEHAQERAGAGLGPGHTEVLREIRAALAG
ncbi:MAG: PH domain-containing protein [Phycisphaerales bacterium]|nr:PH domain-containing protein [Phycisphaerales bacterium]